MAIMYGPLAAALLCTIFRVCGRSVMSGCSDSSLPVYERQVTVAAGTRRSENRPGESERTVVHQDVAMEDGSEVPGGGGVAF
ncbi:hypothetical protein GDO78_014595 [Eleutherodactylus coqui]|uniref:Secreted protein n=1 Tax=Eleutherodactylus coqui TaxID=57060 RepID=A0A8J6ELW3_ELECQ|nr:hypothetical protein GDO78_014595 [Eleutherodactylus coqui]